MRLQYRIIILWGDPTRHPWIWTSVGWLKSGTFSEFSQGKEKNGP